MNIISLDVLSNLDSGSLLVLIRGLLAIGTRASALEVTLVWTLLMSCWYKVLTLWPWAGLYNTCISSLSEETCQIPAKEKGACWLSSVKERGLKTGKGQGG